MDSINKNKELYKNRSDIKLENIKNNNILKTIFFYLQKKIILPIIYYNKKIKQRINININDYKVYSEKYSSIKIEIIPFKNTLDRFLNIKEKDEKYYHIYFNDNQEEIVKTE